MIYTSTIHGTFQALTLHSTTSTCTKGTHPTKEQFTSTTCTEQLRREPNETFKKELTEAAEREL